MLLRLGRFIIDCQYIGIFRCEAPVQAEEKSIHWDWKPEDCKDCFQCRSYLELPEARIKVGKRERRSFNGNEEREWLELL